MKALIAIVLLAAFTLGASEPSPKPKAETKDWWTDFSITPFGAINHPDFGKPQWGGGLDLGYAINKTVSLHVESLAYEKQSWEGPAIDETSLLFRADLIRASKERFVAYVLASGDRDWDRDDWAFGCGIGAELRLAKNLSVGVDSRIRAWFSNDKDLLTRGFVSLRF